MRLRVYVRREFLCKALCVKGKELADNAWGLGFTFARGFQVKRYGRMRSDLGSCALQQVQGLGLEFAAWVLVSAARSAADIKSQAANPNPKP